MGYEERRWGSKSGLRRRKSKQQTKESVTTDELLQRQAQTSSKQRWSNIK